LKREQKNLNKSLNKQRRKGEEKTYPSMKKKSRENIGLGIKREREEKGR
jgi:hypothetical protein